MRDERINEPAFPIVHPDGLGVQFFGLSMRDYFAAKALAGVMTNAVKLDELGDDVLLRAAEQCYRMADAMLEARK